VESQNSLVGAGKKEIKTGKRKKKGKEQSSRSETRGGGKVKRYQTKKKKKSLGERKKGTKKKHNSSDGKRERIGRASWRGREGSLARTRGEKSQRCMWEFSYLTGEGEELQPCAPFQGRMYGKVHPEKKEKKNHKRLT